MSDRVAIITGASQGIGQATAIRLAKDFSALVLVARNKANLAETAKAVEAAGAKTLVIDADLAEPAAAQGIVDKALAAFGRIDALLNIAGAVPQIDVFEMTDRQWDDGMMPALLMTISALRPEATKRSANCRTLSRSERSSLSTSILVVPESALAATSG